MNPVFDGESLAPRHISPLVATVGVRDADDLLTMLQFARFALGNTRLAELEEYLDQRVNAFLQRAEHRGKRLGRGTS